MRASAPGSSWRCAGEAYGEADLVIKVATPTRTRSGRCTRVSSVCLSTVRQNAQVEAPAGRERDVFSNGPRVQASRRR